MLYIITCIIMTVNNSAYDVMFVMYCYIMFCVNHFFFGGGGANGRFKHTLVNKKSL